MVPARSMGRMIMRVGAFDRKLSEKQFHNVSYGHTTSRKLSIGILNAAGDIRLLVKNSWQTIKYMDKSC